MRHGSQRRVKSNVSGKVAVPADFCIRRAPCHGARQRDPAIRIVIILMIAKPRYNRCPIDDRDS
jgi:hypothetical protein